MRVIIDDLAGDDLERIFAWIAQDNPRAAASVVRKLRQRIGQLEAPELPHMGRPGRDPGTRELIEGPFIVVYEVHEGRGEIIVTAIFHGAQDR